MSEESMIILTMLQEGKITAEQADSLLRAVRESAPPSGATVPPARPVTPSGSGPDPDMLSKIQSKLSDLQSKLGDVQGKLGTAQAARAAGLGAVFAEKVMENFPKVDFDVNKIMDEALRGLNSVKNDTIRAAREAARTAGHEARRAARESRRAMKFEFRFEDGQTPESERPVKREGESETCDISETVVAAAGANRLEIRNPYGGVQVTGDPALSDTAVVGVTKIAWAATEAEARALLQQMFVTHPVEDGQCRIAVVVPESARNQAIVDLAIRLPALVPVEVETSFGDIGAEHTSPVLTATSHSGNIVVSRCGDTGEGDSRLSSRSGDLTIENWKTNSGDFSAETVSGELKADGLRCDRALCLSSRSGGVNARHCVAAEMSLETLSGDLSLSDSTAEQRVSLKAQSGGATLSRVRADQVQVDAISGDSALTEVAGALAVKTVSGDIEATQISSRRVTIHTISGDAACAFAAPFSGQLQGHTVSGDIVLRLWTNSDAQIEMSSLNGALNISLPVKDSLLEDARQFRGVMGDGTGSVRLQSVSGDLALEPQA